MAEENVAAGQALVSFRSQGAQALQRVRLELADAHASRVTDLRRANEEYQHEVAIANTMRLRTQNSEVVQSQHAQEVQSSLVRRYDEGIEAEAATARMNRSAGLEEVAELRASRSCCSP